MWKHLGNNLFLWQKINLFVCLQNKQWKYKQCNFQDQFWLLAVYNIWTWFWYWGWQNEIYVRIVLLLCSLKHLNVWKYRVQTKLQIQMFLILFESFTLKILTLSFCLFYSYKCMFSAISFVYFCFFEMHSWFCISWDNFNLLGQNFYKIFYSENSGAVHKYKYF